MTQPSNDIRSLLRAAETIAVVGASDNPARASFQVGQYLIKNGYTVWFVNPNLDTIVGQPVFPSLLDLPSAPDIVDVFRKPADLPAVLAEAISCGAKTLWLQLGIRDEHIERDAIAAGMNVVMDRCIMVDHMELLS